MERRCELRRAATAHEPVGHPLNCRPGAPLQVMKSAWGSDDPPRRRFRSCTAALAEVLEKVVSKKSQI
jgi:hypothetical protein